LFGILLLQSCVTHNNPASEADALELDLKKGALISCAPGEQQYGTLSFRITAKPASRRAFALGVKLLHSFEYDESEKVFAGIIDREPGCAMAYWGVAMSNFHALWAPPTETELKKGARAVARARAIRKKTDREAAYIEAIGAYFDNWTQSDHRTRTGRFEQAMSRLYERYPDDPEAAIFYALALNAHADPADKTYARQLKAGELLKGIYPGQPDHPGLVHYLIHTYDYPELATQALTAARRYASVAPSSAHALHMPSHIFTRLGLWEECIRSNRMSVESAQCYARGTGMKGRWDQELHGMDYLMYAYLQQGDNRRAMEQWDSLRRFRAVEPAGLISAYALAAIPARYVLENRQWKEAAALATPLPEFPWQRFPWQKAMVHFARFLGAVHTGQEAAAATELTALKELRTALEAQKDAYKAGQVAIQIRAAEAWMLFRQGRREEAAARMQEAVTAEEQTGKHPVTPGEVLPARELQGDLLMEMERWPEALEAYEADLQAHPGRFNGLYGAALAAQRSGRNEKARSYFQQLLKVAAPGSDRAELATARRYLEGR
jgi:tetratricopeptide (TPR) repeat protein